MLIWKHRDNPDFVQGFTDALTKFSDEQTVFDEIEFYLPQLAHMIVHLEVDWPNQALEKFALVVCQSSLHVALQLNWILLAAMEDYQPEDADGYWNPNSNPVYYTRCARLLQVKQGRMKGREGIAREWQEAISPRFFLFVLAPYDSLPLPLYRTLNDVWSMAVLS